jgi:hypothetical protein
MRVVLPWLKLLQKKVQGNRPIRELLRWNRNFLTNRNNIEAGENLIGGIVSDWNIIRRPRKRTTSFS